MHADTDLPAPSEHGVARCQVDGVIFDQRSGIGSVPNAANIEYFGFVVMMKPSVFLSLMAPAGVDNTGFIRQHIADGGAIGSPFLTADVERDGPPVIKGHEGRNRMVVLMDLLDDAEVPVCCFVADDGRARDVTEDMIEKFRESAFEQRNYQKSDSTPSLVEGPLFGDAFLMGRRLAADPASSPSL